MARVPLSAAAAAGARRWTRRRAVHAAFEIGVVLKGIDGVLEIAGAALLLAVTPRQIARVVAVREASVGRVPSRAGGVRCRGPRGTPPMLVPMLVAAVLAADPCAPVVDRAALAEEVGAAVRKAKPLGVNDVRYEPDEFRLLLVRADETACVVNLVNFAGEYCAEPASRRAEVVARFVRAVATSCGERPPVPATYAEAKPLLFPVVRSRSFLEAYPLADGVAGEPLGEDLLVALVRDLPDTMSYVSAGQLAGWNVTWRTAYADALANLRARSAEPLKEVSPGLWSGPWSDAYGSSRLLLGDKLRALVKRGDPVVTIPVPNALLVCGSEDAAALERLATITEAARAEPRPVTLLPIVISKDGAARVFAPPATHPAYAAMRRLRLLESLRIYQADKERIDQENQRSGKDVFVANYMVVQDPRGALWSLAVLTVGVHTLLPRTDLVVFVDLPQGPIASARFDDALRLLGGRAVPRPGYPPRWEIEDLPPKEDLAKLGRLPGF